MKHDILYSGFSRFILTLPTVTSLLYKSNLFIHIELLYLFQKMSLNIDYVQDENYNVDVKYYKIDPASYIGRLSFPTSMILTNHVNEDQRDLNLDNAIVLNNNKLNSAECFFDAVTNEENETSEDGSISPHQTGAKKLRGEEEGRLDDKPEYMKELESGKKAIREDIALVNPGTSFEKVSQLDIQEEDVNQNFKLSNEQEAEGKREEESRNYVQSSEDKNYSNEEPRNPVPGAGSTKKTSNVQKYSEELKSKVISHAKSHSLRVTAKAFGIPYGTLSHWCSNHSLQNALTSKIATRILNEVIDVVVKSKFKKTVLSYADKYTFAKAAQKFKVAKSSIHRWKAELREPSDVKPRCSVKPSQDQETSESFEDLYSDEDSLGAKKRKRRKMSPNALSDDDDDANSLGVCKKRNKTESAPLSNNESKAFEPLKDSHQLRFDVLDYATKHSFEEASEVFKVDMKTISSWLYF